MKTLITHSELDGLGSGDIFHVTPDMLLTPSARDYATQHGVRLVYPERGRTTDPVTARGPAESAMDRAIRDAVRAELGQADGGMEQQVLEAVLTGLAPRAATTEVRSTDMGGQALQAVERPRNRAVLSAMGENRTGILSRLTGVMARLGCDIADVSQTLVGGYFTMILIVDLDSLEGDRTFADFREQVLAETGALGLEAMLVHEDVLRAMHRV